jgi:hypothetical protein
VINIIMWFRDMGCYISALSIGKLAYYPKSGGGLGIKDLKKFGRALRMRWLWHRWDTKEKP